MWELAADIRDVLGRNADPASVRRAVLEALRPLVEAGYANIGHLTRHGRLSELTPWSLDGRSAMDELERQWIQLARDPQIGDLGWLQLTPLGETVARTFE